MANRRVRSEVRRQRFRQSLSKGPPRAGDQGFRSIAVQLAVFRAWCTRRRVWIRFEAIRWQVAKFRHNQPDIILGQGLVAGEVVGAADVTLGVLSICQGTANGGDVPGFRRISRRPVIEDSIALADGLEDNGDRGFRNFFDRSVENWYSQNRAVGQFFAHNDFALVLTANQKCRPLDHRTQPAL